MGMGGGMGGSEDKFLVNSAGKFQKIDKQELLLANI